MVKKEVSRTRVRLDILQKIEIFITTTVRTSNPTDFPQFLPSSCLKLWRCFSIPMASLNDIAMLHVDI
jgi:hypothetical protein